ncbi:MAG TPA: hypothetical protein VFR07_04770 [Mycobacteriales bacterium]|jgi:hypothetical protein|nr:hypothetical protein [Mycobacteriales bacterium]
MTRLERLAVLAFLVVLLALFVLRQPVSAGFGALAGIAAALAVADRLGRVRRTIDARLGDDVEVPPSGLRVQVVVRRALLQIVVLAALLLVAVFTPFVGENAYAVAAAAATAFPAVLAAERARH